MTILFFVFGFLLGASAIVFAAQNTQLVELSFIGYQFESSLALLVIVALGVGILISLLAFVPYAISESFKIIQLQGSQKKLVKELEAREQDLLAAHSAVVSQQ